MFNGYSCRFWWDYCNPQIPWDRRGDSLCHRYPEDVTTGWASVDPVVTITMASYSVAVLGEVNRPGNFQVSREKITIFEALAQAGDLTIYGVRDRVKLIREDATGKKSVVTLNLTDANIINSPYYYLQQNDVVYVEPNKLRRRTQRWDRPLRCGSQPRVYWFHWLHFFSTYWNNLTRDVNSRSPSWGSSLYELLDSRAEACVGCSPWHQTIFGICEEA